jgi:hypothetical protein
MCNDDQWIHELYLKHMKYNFPDVSCYSVWGRDVTWLLALLLVARLMTKLRFSARHKRDIRGTLNQ